MNALTQLYSVDEIRTDKGTIRCHETVACQLIVRSSDDAQLICYNPSNVLDGLYSLSDLLKCKSCLLKGIRYTIIGTADDRAVLTQRYKHDFTTPVELDNSLNMTPKKGALFLPYQLDVLLDTKNKFPKVTAIQFIA
jgi:hypothetical protein